MNFRPLRLASRLFLPAILAAHPLRAQKAEVSATKPPAEEQALRKVSGLFDTDLPKTERKGSIRFIVHPYFGDFTRRSYVRLPLGIRWGVNDHVEVTEGPDGLRIDTGGKIRGEFSISRWFRGDQSAKETK